MSFTNTTIVPPGDADLVLKSENTIKMIVIGNRPEVAQKADDLTLNPPIAIRKVIWFSNGLPAALQTKYGVNPDSQAFVLNINNVVRDEILSTEIVDNVRVSRAYVKGAKV